MTIGTRIKNLRLSKSLTQKELSQQTHSSIVTVQCWENGSKNPSMDAIIMLSKVFNVSADYLLGIQTAEFIDSSLIMSKSEKAFITEFRQLDDYGQKLVRTVCSMEMKRSQSNENKSVANTKLRYIPIYSTPSAAGMSVPLDCDDFEMIPVNELVPEGADFAVKIQGNSMMPYIDDGNTVYVQRSTDIRNGDIGIFAVDGAMYCKHFYKDKSGNVTLVSSNPDFMDSNIIIDVDSSNSITCYGKVLLELQPKLPKYFQD